MVGQTVQTACITDMSYDELKAEILGCVPEIGACVRLLIGTDMYLSVRVIAIEDGSFVRIALERDTNVILTSGVRYTFMQFWTRLSYDDELRRRKSLRVQEH